MQVGINFVIFDWNRWAPILSQGAPPIHCLARHIVSNEDIWSVQTYLQLAARGLRATISSAPQRGKINIVDGITFRPPSFAPDVFCVGCRGDGHYPGICQVAIHQNPLEFPHQPSIYIPQWPQPGIIPRDPARRGVKTLGFLGHADINLAPEYKDSSFADALRKRGCSLLVRRKSATQVDWNDYAEIDLVLAVRRIPQAHLLLKPFTKLVNAWMARVPALIGPEPAVAAIGRSGVDYLLIDSTNDVFRALDTFADRPDLYQELVDRGVRRAELFSESAIANRWMSVLAEIGDRYELWARMNERARMQDFWDRVKRHQLSIQTHVESVYKGYTDLGYPSRWWETRDG
jgi:hypothetical protein